MLAFFVYNFLIQDCSQQSITYKLRMNFKILELVESLKVYSSNTLLQFLPDNSPERLALTQIQTVLSKGHHTSGACRNETNPDAPSGKAHYAIKDREENKNPELKSGPKKRSNYCLGIFFMGS